MRRLLATVAIAAAALSARCTPAPADEVAVVMADTDPMGWSAPVTAQFENRDTTALSDLSIVVRYGSRTDAESLPLTLTFTAPDSARFTESAVLPLSHPRKPASMAALEAIPYRRRVRLSQAGTYTVTIMPARRIRGIEAVGLSVQKNDTPWEKTN